MPIYEYICDACGHEFDTIQKFSEKPIRKCPECGKAKAKRKISMSAFHLKGSGWYVTDYKKPSGEGSSKPAEAKPESGETRAETKDKGTSDGAAKPEKADKKPDKSKGSKKEAPAAA